MSAEANVIAEPKRRLFFALWPSASVQEAFSEVARAALGAQPKRYTSASNIHLTVAFMGARGASQQVCMEAAALAVRHEPFSLTFDVLGVFGQRDRDENHAPGTVRLHRRQSGILWAGCSREPPALLELVNGLNVALVPCGYTPDARPFRAHVTLARGVGRAKPVSSFAPLGWNVNEFVLVESKLTVHGAQYNVLHRYPLVDHQ